MSTPVTWCDKIIIQAVANTCNCRIINITESDINKLHGTTIPPVLPEGRPNPIFIGYIELHYVSTVLVNNSQNKNRLTYH